MTMLHSHGTVRGAVEVSRGPYDATSLPCLTIAPCLTILPCDHRAILPSYHRAILQVARGLYYGGDLQHAAELVRRGAAAAADFAFYRGRVDWQPGAAPY